MREALYLHSLSFQIYRQRKSFLNRIRRTVADESALSFGIRRFLSLCDAVNVFMPFTWRSAFKSRLQTILSRFFNS